MIYSMTGFGRAESKTPLGRFVVEARAVNNRYLDIQLRVPQIFSGIEDQINRYVAEKIARGKLYINIYLEKGNGGKGNRFVLDGSLIKEYFKLVGEIKKHFNVSGDLNINTVLSFPDIIKAEIPAADMTAAWKYIRNPLGKALFNLMLMRGREGKNIMFSMRKHIAAMEKALSKIEKAAPERLKNYRERLHKKMCDIAGDAKIDANRLAAEVTIMADRLDIDEECVRLRSHIQQFIQTLEEGGTVGKRLDFLLQEMNREANTITAKANDARISHQSVFLKERVETLREQVQNIE